MIRACRGRALPIPLAAVIGLGLAAAGCGYALAGRGNALPSHIQVIGVPDFINATPSPELDQVVSDAVRQEFQSRGRFRVLPEAATADGVLTGTIVRLDLVPGALNQSLQASRYVVTMVVSVEFKDATNNNAVLWANPNMSFREEYELPPEASATDPTLFFRQDANALTRLSQNFAKTVVTSILEAF